MANAMTSEPAYQALFLSAGPHMTCGVGQFTRLSRETLEKLEPGSCSSLTLTRRELAEDAAVGWTTKKCVLAPLPPNIEAPPGIVDSKLRQRLAAARESGRLVIGHFGSIYPGKQPNALLHIGAILKARGLKPL